ncbi:egl-9, partial [Symbiodinium sp. KB8]
PWLWQGFATEKEVQDAAAEMDVLRERGVLKAANADTTGAQKLDNEKPASCLRLFRRMEAAVAALRWSEGGQLLRPKFGMAAVYDKGGSYAPHRDNERTGQRLRQWVNFRALTAVIYVNPSGFTSPEDGGQLRCHLGAKIDDLSGATALEVQDVAPRGGLAVLFPARRVLHEVLPSFRQRYALTLWFVAPAAGLD